MLFHVLFNYYDGKCFIDVFILFVFCVISGFRREVASSSNSIPTFRDSLSVLIAA